MADKIIKKVHRLIYLLNELNKGKVILSELSKDLNVSMRTLQRDVKILEFAKFPIIYPEKGKYCFMDGFTLEKMKLTQKEAAMLAIFADITCVLGDNFSEAFDNLQKRVIQEPLDNPFYVKIQKGYSYPITRITKTIEKAVNDCEKVYINYERGKPNDDPISPLKIVWYDGYWYLLALGHKGILLKLRLEKIKEAKLTGKFFKKPAGLEKTLEESSSIWFEGKRDKLVKMRISEYAMKYFKSKNYFPKQKIVQSLKNGEGILECFIAKYEEITPTILSWIPHIKVIKPKELVDIINQKIDEYLKK